MPGIHEVEWPFTLAENHIGTMTCRRFWGEVCTVSSLHHQSPQKTQLPSAPDC